LSFTGLDARIEVYRDGIGIAHIRASSMKDAFFAQGCTHASDRLWQMDHDRMRASGRWAEIAGPKGVAQDRLTCQMRLAETARFDYQGLMPETRAMLDAYCLGVNAFISGIGHGSAFAAVCAGLPGEEDHASYQVCAETWPFGYASDTCRHYIASRCGLQALHGGRAAHRRPLGKGA